MTIDDVYVNDLSFYEVKDKLKNIRGNEELFKNMMLCVYKCLSGLIDHGNIYFQNYSWLRCSISLDFFRRESLKTLVTNSRNQLHPHNGSYRMPFQYDNDWTFIFHISDDSSRILAYFVNTKIERSMIIYFHRYMNPLVTDNIRLKDIV